MNTIYSVICKSLTHKNETYLDFVPNSDCEILEQAIQQAMNAIHEGRRHFERYPSVVLSLIETDLNTGITKTIYNRRELEEIYDDREHREQVDGIVANYEIKQRKFLEAAE